MATSYSPTSSDGERELDSEFEADLAVRLDLFEEFLQKAEGLAEGTAEQHAYSAGQFLRRAGTLSPTEIDALEFRDTLIDEGWSNSHINNVTNAMRYYFSLLGEDETLEGVPVLTRRKTKPEPIPDDKVEIMIRAAETRRDTAILRTLETSGIRASEVCRLDVGDLEINGGDGGSEAAKLHIYDGKGDKDRTAFINTTALESIEEYLEWRSEDSPVLFLNKYGDPLTRSGILDIVKRVADRAGVDNMYTHRYRDTFAKRLLDEEKNLKHIKELMGHDSIRSTMRYLSVSDHELSEVYTGVFEEDEHSERGETGR